MMNRSSWRARVLGFFLSPLAIAAGAKPLSADPAAAGPKPTAPPAAQVPQWEKFGEDDGIAVYRRDVAGSPIVALRGDGVVDAPILRVASVLVDFRRAPEWIDSVAETRIIRQISETEYVEWDHVTTPFVIKDRDFVFDDKIEIVPARSQLVLRYHSVDDPAAPRTSYVRGQFLDGSFVLTSIERGAKTAVTAELIADPKGSVPKWIVNLFQKSWPHNTIEALRRQVKKPDIVDHPQLKAALAKAGF